ncbi:Ethylene-responsive transcription factor CRF6 [Capsicum chinense]|nr:Ethylene-responsive transcription factor CRF6 [Capsicum chinense]
MEKVTDQIGGSSYILPRSGVVYYSGYDPTKLSTYEEGKAKGKKSEIHEKACEEEPIVKNENTEVISIENSLERDLKMPQEKVKMYEGFRQRKPGKWVAEVRVLGTKDRIWIGTFNTAKETSLAYDETIIEMKGADAATNILKPPPGYTPPTEINYMNPPSLSTDKSWI